jgi:hypothetical protein
MFRRLKKNVLKKSDTRRLASDYADFAKSIAHPVSANPCTCSNQHYDNDRKEWLILVAKLTKYPLLAMQNLPLNYPEVSERE